MRTVSRLAARVFAATLAAAALGAGASGAQAASAPAALGVDWSMPNRLSEPIEESWAKNPWGLPTREYVDPSSWKVDLFLTEGGKATCPDVNRHFIWTVTGEGISEHPGRPPSGPGSGSGVNCRPTATVPKLGVYQVTATEYTDSLNSAGAYTPTGKVYANDHVVVRDWLIVGLGDSNASGEGNPDEVGAKWLFAQCDRSVRSYQNLVADYVGLEDSRTSVTFVPAGCSGARTENLFSAPYEGIHGLLEKVRGAPLPPQLTQVRAVIGSRKPDAVIVSIGINDIGFSPLLFYCIPREENILAHVHCEKNNVVANRSPGGELEGYSSGSGPTLETQTRSLVHGLPRLYHALAGAIGSLSPAHVFITQYPNLATNELGTTCAGVSGPAPHFFSSTWEWLERTGGELNAAVAGTSALGWTPVTGIPGAFVGHGYCSKASWFLPLSRAYSIGDLEGAFHAILPGQLASARFTIGKVCDAFYGNPRCHGRAPAP